MRIPSNIIQTGKYTSGGEFVEKLTNKPYQGYYYELNGSLYTKPLSPISGILYSSTQSWKHRTCGNLYLICRGLGYKDKTLYETKKFICFTSCKIKIKTLCTLWSGAGSRCRGTCGPVSFIF